MSRLLIKHSNNVKLLQLNNVITANSLLEFNLVVIEHAVAVRFEYADIGQQLQ
jgi:hypothetical protein